MMDPYQSLLKALAAQWATAVKANFKVGEVIDRIHQRYSRDTSYACISRDLEGMGCQIAADTLRCYHQAYLLQKRTPATFTKRLVNLPHSHWVEAARRCPELSDKERIAALSDAARDGHSTAQLRHNLFERSVKEQRRQQKRPRLTGDRAQFILGDCLQVLKSLSNRSVDVVITSPPFNTLPQEGNLTGMFGQNRWSERARSGYNDVQPEEVYQAWLGEVVEECLRVSRGLVWIHHKTRYRNKQAIHPLHFLPFPLYCEIIWDRGISMVSAPA